MHKILFPLFTILSAICFGQQTDTLLIKQLNTIYLDDARYRNEAEGIAEKYGKNSKELSDQWKLINKTDSINQLQVTKILDKHGWLGPDAIGDQAGAALFFVIQHANLQTQEKYLPLMKEAGKKGKLSKSRLALLEDRIAIKQGKKQIYGSQIGVDSETGLNYIFPLEDPDNVDKRRAAVGLPPMAVYANAFQTNWDVEQYKKDLPRFEALQQKKYGSK